MNSKKSKNKNRAKTTNVLPTPNVVSSEVSDKLDVTTEEHIQDENKQYEQTCSEIIPCENVPTIKETLNPEDIPVKPKRKKGKKKQQDEIINEQKITCSDDPLIKTASDILDVVDQPLEINSDIENQIKNTTSRKKKNKSKKQIEKCKTEEIIAEEILTKDFNIEISTKINTAAIQETEEEKLTKVLEIERSTESDTVSSQGINEEKLTKVVNFEICSKSDTVSGQETVPKKKHKKKKHPPDSVKTEDVTCTSAFQHILEPGDSHDESVTEKQNTDTTVPEVMIEECSEKIEPMQTAKNKKKNKKNRKPSPTVIAYDEEQKESHENFMKISRETEENNVTPELTSEAPREPSPKPKAKIAKPVDKKRRNKNILMLSNNENNTTVEDVSKEPTSSTFEDVKNDGNFEVQVNLNHQQQETPEKVTINIDTVEVEKFKDTNIETIEKDIECQQVASDNIQEDEKLCEKAKEHDDTLFIEVRPSRKKKKSAKSCSEPNDSEKNTTESINDTDVSSQNNLKTGQVEDANITPDFIHYPRSSSQQQINNNTDIQEIHSPDEVRLGIPILMSIPVIQGSGESPEVISQIDPLDVEVIEIKTNEPKQNNNTTTIQSGSIVDSQVMEELKLSIEKSLAELTAIEKEELEAEKQFMEVLHDSPVNIPVETTAEGHIPIDSSPKADNDEKLKEKISDRPGTPPVCPSRKDKKGKSKKRCRKGTSEQAVNTTTTTSSGNTDSNKVTRDTSTKDKETKSEDTQNKGKQQSAGNNDETEISQDTAPAIEVYYEPIDNFEDALTSSNDDINKTFEMIAKEVNDTEPTKTSLAKPVISITEPEEDRKENGAKENPVSQPKNLLGHHNIPVSSNKSDYKKEKDKPPNSLRAKVKIRDSVDIEKTNKRSKESQTLRNKPKQNAIESNTYKTNENDDFVYKYSFRKVFLPNICHVCNKELCVRVPCTFCNLVFYCSPKHKDDDWSKHQSICFAVCTIAHLKEQKFIYGNAKNIIGQDYRLLRMQMIMSCEKMLKRKLVPWEQEALLYPRVCADAGCREWKQGHLTDCAGCKQMAFCTDHPEHLPISHQRWCNSYALYHKLVNYQQTKGRLEPRLPNKVMTENYVIPEKVNEVLASLYEEKIDMDDIQYATLTQIASAPLTAAFSYQMSRRTANGMAKKTTFAIHIVGAELQFEADVLNKWEKFFLHLRPDVKDLRIVLINPNLNPSNLPLDLLRRVKLCEHCRSNNRRLLFHFEDKTTYLEYYTSEDFISPDIVCAFNPSIERSSMYNGNYPWPATLKCIAKLKAPFLLTAYTLNELLRDLARLKQCSSFDIISEPQYNNFASVRPDRNFITDDEMPLLFKNYCFSVVCGS